MHPATPACLMESRHCQNARSRPSSPGYNRAHVTINHFKAKTMSPMMIRMKKFVAAAVLLTLVHSSAHSQLYMTRAGFVGFYSKMPLEDIKAENNQVLAVVDPAKKNLAFSLLLK